MIQLPNSAAGKTGVENIIYGKGIGKTKKEAEQMAAKDALNKRANV